MSELSKDRLTVIVPVYNEAACLSRFRRLMDVFLSRVPISTGVLFVNDGSTDDSQAIIDEICAADDRYRSITLQTNTGVSTAIKAGIDTCNTSLIGLIDADCQTDPLDFLSFLPLIPEYDLINGIRTNRQDRLVKKISSKVANRVRRAMLNDGIKDTCCPLKIIKSDYVRTIPFFKGTHRFLPALVQLAGGRVQQIPVAHYPRYGGAAKYHIHNRLFGPLFDTLAHMWMKRRYIRYQIKKKN